MSIELTIPDGMDIKRSRMEKGISQGELADLVGVSQPAISRMESGDMNVTVDTLRSIVTAINEA